MSTLGSHESAAEMNQRDILRNEARARRAAMPAPYRAHKSAELCKRLEESLLLTLGITGIQPQDAIVAVYAAFPEEVDLGDFIASTYRYGCRVAFPCMVRDAWKAENTSVDQTMEMRLVPYELYQTNKVPFIEHPLRWYRHSSEDLVEFPYASAEALTMLVVPVVGFDKAGNRLGYGYGNYDRYLAQTPRSCRVAGVAFDEQYVDAIPTEEHDISVPIVAL